MDPLVFYMLFDGILVFGKAFQKMAQSCHAFNGKTVLRILVKKTEVFENVQLLQMRIGHVAFAPVLERTVKATAPRKVLMIDNKYGKVTFFHRTSPENQILFI